MSCELDEEYMRLCLELAARAMGRTSPNPMVGCVVLDKEGEVVGQGLHKRAGEAHAEVNALNEAADKARGGTLYVNLEPCCHFGKTPPCTEAIVKSGVKRVVTGGPDPNHLVAGGGIRRLKEAGIEVTTGVLAGECRWLNRGFIKCMQQSLPWLTLKLASTLDGRIADRHHASRWVSGSEARAFVHHLRNTYDVVLVGALTAEKDDPALSVRGIPESRNPARAVIDSSLRLPRKARICQDDSALVYLFTLEENHKRAEAAGYPAHVQLIGVKPARSGGLDLRQALSFLCHQGMRTVLCEGGGRLAAGLLWEGLIDEVKWIIAPKILGDALAVPAIGGEQPVALADCWRLRQLKMSQLGDDLLVEGTLANASTI